MYWYAIEEYIYICVFVISKCPTHKADTAIVLSSGTLLGSHIPRDAWLVDENVSHIAGSINSIVYFLLRMFAKTAISKCVLFFMIYNILNSIPGS